MLFGGLWYGAGWTFVVWGALHGVYLTLNHWWRELIAKKYLRRVLGWIGTITGGTLTFIMVVAAWVVFRANNMPQAVILLKTMLVAAHPISVDAVQHGDLLLLAELSGRDLLCLLVPGLLWVWLLPNSTQVGFIKHSTLLTLLQGLLVLYILFVVIDQFGSYSPSLYFQF